MPNTKRKTSNVVTFPLTASTEIRKRIKSEQKRLEIDEPNQEWRTGLEILVNFMEVAELNAVYLADLEINEVEPVIESLIDSTAKMKFWLEL